MSLRFKMLLFTMLFLCLPFLAILFVWLHNSSATIERTASDYGKALMKQTVDYVDTYFRGLEQDTSQLLTMPSVQAFMQLNAMDDYKYYATVTRINEDISKSSLYSRDDMRQIDFVSGKRIVYSTYSFASLDNNEYANALQNRAADRTYAIGGITMDNSGLLSGPLLSYYRYYSDYVYRDIKDMIIIYLDLSRIEMVSDNTLLREAGFLSIINQAGNYVYHPDRSLMGTKADPSLAEMPHEEMNEFVESRTSNKRLFIRQQSDYTGWTFVYEVPLRALSGELLPMQQITILVIICLIALVLLILGGFAFYLSRRITFLQKLMRQAEDGNLNVKAPEHSGDELGGLYRSFNHMLMRIRRLIDEVNDSHAKERELQKRQEEMMIEVMQTQINPHFLYNTLEVINSYAILEGIRPINTLAVSLSKMFRYSVNNDEPIVNLHQEMEHIRTYCHILLERNASLQVLFELDEQMLQSVACVRLALQPLIENAFLHGYERSGFVPDKIAIRGTCQGEAYELRIQDYGAGMPLEMIKRYNEAFAWPQVETADADMLLNGVGLWNVHRRIRLTFGEPYGLHVSEQTSKGFEIRLKLPVISMAHE